MGPLRRTCATAPRRGPLPKLLWADLLLISTDFKTTTLTVIRFLLPVSANFSIKRFDDDDDDDDDDAIKDAMDKNSACSDKSYRSLSV